jgi:predicted RND superfamily exporter protein
MNLGSSPTPAVGAYVRFLLRHGRAIWGVAIFLGVLATYRTGYLYAHLRSELEALLPNDAPSVVALTEMRRRSPGLEFLGVMVAADDASELPDAERFLDDLAARIRRYPPELVRDVRTNNATEKAFLEKHAPLYVDVDDLKTIRERIETRRDYEVSKASGVLLDESEPPPNVDMSDIRRKYENRTFGAKGGHFTSPELKATMLAVEAGSFTTGADKDRVLLARVRSDVASLDLARYGRRLRVGYASDVAINVEELDALEQDLSVSSVLVMAAVMAAIVAYYRWWKSVPVLIPPLLLATVYAFALASLPPMRVTELNSNTAFLGAIIVGNGINVGLVLLARYREERLCGASVEQALIAAVWGARVGTLAAAVAAGVSYASLLITEFRGFRQFGYIGGVGMLASWVTAFVLVPPLLGWLDRRDPSSQESPRRTRGIMRGLARLIERGAPFVVAAATVLAAAAAFEASRLDSSHLEYDFSKLRRADTWKNGEGYWGRKMDALLGHFLTPTVILCDSRGQARDVERAVRDSVDHGVLRPMVARVVGADDVLPVDQPEKIEETKRIRNALTPRIRSLVAPDQRDEIDRLLGDPNLLPLRVSDLPHSFTMGLAERDGTLGRLVLVYPRPSDALWKAESIHRFVKTLRDFAALDGGGTRPGRVAGSIPLSSDILASIGRDAPIASAGSFLGVVVVILVLMRGHMVSAYVIGSLLTGVLWLVGAIVFFGIKINFVNFIAFPITFGIGVDYSVNVMTRFVQDGSRDVAGAVRSTGGAVALCSLTTIIGYSSLLMAKNRALYLFGLVAVMGEVACLTAAVVALPALLTLLRRLRETPASSASDEPRGAS